MLTKRLRAQMSDIRNLRAQIEDMLPSRRSEAIRQERVMTNKTLAFAEAEKAVYQKRQRDSIDHPGRALDAELRRQSFQLLRVVLTVVSAVLQIVITHASFEVSWIVSGVTGVALTLALSLIVEETAVWLSHRVNMPARSIRIALSFAKWTGAVVVLAISILLFTRVASVELVTKLHLAAFGTISLMIVAEGAAIVAGCLSAAAIWLADPQRIDEMLLDLDELIFWIKDYAPPSVVPEESQVVVPVGARFSNGVGAALILGLLLAPQSMALANEREISARSLPAQITASAGAAITGAGSECLIAIDVTSSLSQEGLSKALDRVSLLMEEFVEVGRCRSMTVAHFSDGGLRWADQRHISIADVTTAIECDSVRVSQKNGTEGLLDKFGSVRDAAIKEAKRVCEGEERGRKDKVRMISDSLNTALRNGGLVTTGRSGVKRVIRDAIRKGFSNTIVISDGHDNVDSSISVMAVPAPMQVTLVLVEPRAGLSGLSESEIADYERTFPNIRAVTHRELRSGIFRTSNSQVITSTASSRR